MKQKQKYSIVEILITAGVFLVVSIVGGTGILPDIWWVRLIAYLIPYFLIGRRVLWKAACNIARGQIFDENFLMTIATIGAFCLGDYAEAVFVMLFYRVGELFEELSVGKSRASIASLMDIRPDYANLEAPHAEGGAIRVSPEEVAVGDIILIRPGERIPLDGVIVDGISSLNTVALTGESVPRDVMAGDDVISGCVNLTGLLRVRVTRHATESTVAKILELVENSGAHKSRSEHFITRFARIYTPAVVLAAVALAVLPPLFIDMTSSSVWMDWVGRALSFLVISCPCALVISVPLSFFGGIGGASRQGILIKGSSYMECLAACDTVVFDKTGTLTRGAFTVTDILPADGMSDVELLRLAATAERYSSHPIAHALAAASPACGVPVSVEELAGYGVRAWVEGSDRTERIVCVGNLRLMETEEAHAAVCDLPGTVVYVAVNGQYAGCIVVSDTIKNDAAEAVSALRGEGIGRTVMLTGDNEQAARAVAVELGLDEYHAALLPADKVGKMEAILATPEHRGKVAYVGDGINDAPVLALADVGIAMGGMGSDAAIEAADVVLMDDKPMGIARAVRIARKTMRIVRQNIVFAIGVKFLVMILGALGTLGAATLWAAVFADVGVSVLAILNAMRAMR